MDFDALKKLIQQQKLAQLAGQSGPKDLGNTSDMANKMALDSYAGDVKQPEGAEPTDSPIDYIAGGLGGKLGGAMARDASGILGNEIGSIGYIPEGASRAASELKHSQLLEKLKPVLDGKGALPESAGKYANDATLHNAALEVMQQGAEKGIYNPLDLQIATDKAGRAQDFLNKNSNLPFVNLKNKLLNNKN